MNFDPDSALVGQFDHIVLHNDGNNNDPDDIAAVPIEAALIKAAGLEDQSTIFYNNNLGEPDDASMVAKMRESAAFAEKLGIQTHDYQAGTDQATAELVKILDSGQKVLALEGGPMEAIYRALEQTSPENRANVTLISHSSFNEDRNVASRPGVEDVRTWDDIRNDFPGVELIETQDQNGSNNAGFNNSQWNWLDSTADPSLQEARELMRNAGGAKANDPSDAGMLFYALTGNEAADPQDAQTFFEEFPLSPDNPTPTPAPEPTPAPDPNSQALLTFALVDADTEQVVKGYEDLGANPQIDLSALDLTQFNVVAQVNSEHPDANSVQSVRFESNLGNIGNRTENVVPYALLGDIEGDFNGQDLKAGDYTIKATAFTEKKGEGDAIASLDLDYTVAAVSEPPPSSQSLLTFALVDADTDQIVEGYEDLGANPDIDLNELDLTQFSVVAQVNSDHPDANSVQSVVFESNLGNIGNRTENVVPYALFGDIEGDFNGQDLKAFTIKATAYTEKKGQGDAIGSLDFEYVGSTDTLDINARSLDGSGNNESNPSLGEADTIYSRDAETNYADDISEPVSGPDPRFISNRIFSDQAQNLFSENGVSQWAGYWGQFIDHTIGLRAEGAEEAPIPFNSDDPLEEFQNDLGSIGFERSQPAPGTGETNPREQVNVVSSFIDGWAIYGGTEERLEWLREGPVDGDLSNNGARLLLAEDGNLPVATARGDASSAPTMDLFGRLMGTPDQRIIAGDVRANQSLPLTTIHTLFAREHNRIVDELPDFLGEESKFQIARKVVGAEQQYITYNEFLPAMGVNLGEYDGYDATVDPSITNEFATVGFRAHSQIHGELEIETEADRFSAEQLESFKSQGIEVEVVGDEVELALPLNVAIGQPSLLSEIGIDLVSAALAGEAQYKNDEQIDNQLRSILFQAPSSPDGDLDGPDLPESFSTVADLGSLDVQRGRDHGIPLYNDLREAYGLERVDSFTDITGEATEEFPDDPDIDPLDPINDPDILRFDALLDKEGNVIADPEDPAAPDAVDAVRATSVAARLKAIYGDVDKVDAFVGMVSEEHLAGSEFGELQAALWTDQFEALRDGDRFYYENDADLAQIEQTYGIGFQRTLSEIIADNSLVEPGDLQENVFKIAEPSVG